MSGREKSERSGGSAERERVHAVEWAQAAGATEDVLAAMERRLARRRRRRTGIAGCSALAALILAIGVWQRPGSVELAALPETRTTIVVAAPERRVLEDGSTVELRRGAEVSVAFDQTTRRVTLRDGEAHFLVAKDAARPFVVEADGVAVRAVGTAFLVRREAGAVSLIVTEGRVAVERAAGGKAEITELGAGDGIEVATATTTAAAEREVKTLSRDEMGERLAWRVPTVEFSGTPLAEALAEINRHASVRLVLADRSLETVRVSGVLRGDNVGALLRLLEEEHRVRTEPGVGTELRLVRAR